MKKTSRKTIILALSLILCFAVSVGITAAYFTDYESAKGGAELKLSGQTKLEETVKNNDKTVVITNTGQTDMIVRVQIIGDTDKLDVSAGTGWSKSATDGWWYYKKILKGSPDGKSGESTTAIEAKVSGTVGETNFDIVVVHEGSRTVYETIEKDGRLVEQLVVPNGWDATVVRQIVQIVLQ